MEDFEEDESEVEKYDNVPGYIIGFLQKLFALSFGKTRNPESLRIVELGLINLKYHPLIPLTNCIIDFRHNDISYSVIYTDYKIELSQYNTIDTGFGTDHYESLRMGYYPNGKNEQEGNFDEFESCIFSALSETEEIFPSIEE